MDAVELGFDEALRAGRDMANGAFDLGMRRVLISDVMRLHNGVARLAAKLSGFCDVIRFIAANGCDEKEEQARQQEDRQQFLVASS